MTRSWPGAGALRGWPVPELPPVGPGPLAVGLTTALHRAGLPVTPERAAGLARGLRLVPPVDRPALYWTSRVALVTDRTQLPVFDAVFSAVFDGRLDPADTGGDPTAPPPIGSEPRTRRAPPDDRPAHPGESGASGSTGGSDDGSDSEREV